MDDLEALLQHGLDLQNAGEWERAEQVFLQILAQEPRETRARHALAWLLYRRGDLAGAIGELEQAVQADPDSAVFHSHLGTMLRQAGRAEEAVASFRQALALVPGDAADLFNLGNAYRQLGRHEAAIESYQASLRAVADDADVLLNLAVAQKELGRFDDAHSSLNRALAVRPDFADAWVNLGLVWKAEGDYAQARSCYEQALRLNPRSALAYNNLGALAQAEYQIPEAIACFQEALRIQPKYATAYSNLGDAYQAQGNTSQALASFFEALAIVPGDALRIKAALTLPVILESSSHIDEAHKRLRENIARLAAQALSVSDPVGGVGVPAFYLAYQGRDERDVQRQIAELLRRATPSLAYVAPPCRSPRDRPRNRRLKIGFISQNFYAHTIGKLNRGLIRALDRRQFEVAVVTSPGRDDWVTRDIAAAAEQIVAMPSDLAAARARIATLALDMLFYADIGMDALTYYLAHARLAPVQCVTWGHPLTTGIPTIDYFISAEHLEPAGAEAQYSETLVRLGHLANCYARPPASPSTKSRSDFGFEARAHLYVCPQSLFKLHPDDDAVFAAILRHDPQATIVLIEGQEPNWASLVARRQRNTMGALADRVRFVPRQSRDEFPRLLDLADVILDPLHFGGGNTSYEAFAVGAPIVTLPGGFLRSRITYALYRAMGVTDGIAADRDDYAAKAVRLATDAAWRAKVSARILAENHKIYENTAGVRELEHFLLDVCARR